MTFRHYYWDRCAVLIPFGAGMFFYTENVYYSNAFRVLIPFGAAMFFYKSQSL